MKTRKPVKKRITTRLVPEPPAKTWSQCLRAGNLVFISGQIAQVGNRIVGKGDPLAQCRQAFRNMRALIEAAGGTMDDIVRITVWLTDVRHRPALLKARAEAFKGDFPTVTLVGGVDLAYDDLLVEIDAFAVLPDRASGEKPVPRLRRQRRDRAH